MKNTSKVLLFFVFLMGFLFLTLSSKADETPVLPDYTKAPYGLVADNVAGSSSFYPERVITKIEWYDSGNIQRSGGSTEPSKVYFVRDVVLIFTQENGARHVEWTHCETSVYRYGFVKRATMYGFVWDNTRNMFIFDKKQELGPSAY